MFRIFVDVELHLLPCFARDFQYFLAMLIGASVEKNLEAL